MSGKPVYFKNTPEHKELLKRAQILMKLYGVSFSEIMVAGLKMVLNANRPKPTGDLVRDAKLAGLKS